MFIRQGEKEFHDPWEIAEFCNPNGIEQNYWDIRAVDPLICHEAAINPDYQAVIIDSIQSQLKALKEKNGYLTEDVVCLTPEKPNLDQLLAMFEKEHHHTDDEVRVVLYGRGIFGIVPSKDLPFEIHMAAGDMIVVPAFTRHWFTLYPEREIVALRIFKTSAGWEAIYEPEKVSERLSL